MIEMVDVGMVFERNGEPFTALAGITGEIGEGEFVSIIGPSGCGKTTLLKIMAGLVPPTTGETRVKRERIEGPGEQRALVLQHFVLLP